MSLRFTIVISCTVFLFIMYHYSNKSTRTSPLGAPAKCSGALMSLRKSRPRADGGFVAGRLDDSDGTRRARRDAGLPRHNPVSYVLRDCDCCWSGDPLCSGGGLSAETCVIRARTWEHRRCRAIFGFRSCGQHRYSGHSVACLRLRLRNCQRASFVDPRKAILSSAISAA